LSTHSNATSENVSWPHFSWHTLYMYAICCRALKGRGKSRHLTKVYARYRRTDNTLLFWCTASEDTYRPRRVFSRSQLVSGRDQGWYSVEGRMLYGRLSSLARREHRWRTASDRDCTDFRSWVLDHTRNV